LGCLVLGVVLGVVGFCFIHIAWRWMVIRRWKIRHDS